MSLVFSESSFFALISSEIILESSILILSIFSSLVAILENRDSGIDGHDVQGFECEDSTIAMSGNDGIHLYGEYVTISDSIIKENRKGIELFATHSLIIDSYIENNTDAGIGSWKDNTTLLNNTLINNGIWTHNPNQVMANNTLNGKDIHYYSYVDSIQVPSNAGQVIVINSSNIVIENVSISNISSGWPSLFVRVSPILNWPIGKYFPLL